MFSREYVRRKVDAVAKREAAAPAYLEQARRSLAELVEYAASAGIAIGLENRLHFHEIPQVDEVALLLQPYAPEQAGYWHDVGHAEILDRIGLVPLEEWFQRLGSRLIGCHLHDMNGIVDHRAPGTGDVDWSRIATAVSGTKVRTLEINQHQPEESLGTALALLRREGVVPDGMATGVSPGR